MIVASRRAPGFSGSSPMPSGGVGVHSFMTFGLCTRNEKCAPAPLTNQALHAGCLRVARGPVWRRHPHDRADSVQLRTSRLKLRKVCKTRSFKTVG